MDIPNTPAPVDSGFPTNDLERMQAKVAQAYQVIGNLLDKAGTFESPEGQRALDYFSTEEYDDDFLPWPRDGK